jgi:chitinase
VTVRYTTQDGTATAGSDYQAQSGTLTFAPGETTKTVQIAIYGDRTLEADESFQLLLSDPTGNALISDPLGVGLIINDDFHGRGNGKGNHRFALALAVDAAIEDWITGRPKKRCW